MQNKILDTVVQEKDLRVIITNYLSASQQCTHTYSKASKMLGVINRTIKNREILLKSYKSYSLVHPHLEYCAAAWSSHYVKDKTEKIQLRFTRTIPQSKRSAIFRKIKGIDSLDSRRKTSQNRLD